MKQPIGVFDSGVGGLTVLKAIRKLLPGERFVYLGDTARVPYGSKSPETIMRYSRENARFLLRHDVKMIVIACNSSTATSLATLQRELPVPVVGVIEPGAHKAVEVSRSGRIGVIGTEATVKSGAYADRIRALRKDAVVVSRACPLFVPLVEEGLTSGAITDSLIYHYLEPFRRKFIDTIVLGCTHYPLLKQPIRKFFEGRVRVVDSADETAIAVRTLLGADAARKSVASQPARFFVTDAAERFIKVGRTIMKGDLDKVSLVTIA